MGAPSESNTTGEAGVLSEGASVVPSPPRGRQPQRTLARSVSVTGVGFVSAADVCVRFCPASADSGIVFVRTDLPQRPRIAVCPQNILVRRRRTALGSEGATLEMTEHILAALAGCGIDNCKIEIDAGEAPGMDGSASAFVEAILQVGSVAQDVSRRPYVVTEPLSVNDGDAVVGIHPGPTDRLDITFTLDYGEGGPVGKQSLMVSLSPEFFRAQIAPARTFILEREIQALREQGLGARTTAKDLLVFGEDGRPIDNQVRFVDECVRHKILDVVGDLTILGRPLCGHFVAHKGGHHLNVQLVQKLAQQARQQGAAEGMATGNRPLLDSVQIEKIIPHRYPFLLVDRVLELTPGQSALGVKNVSYNEPFFQGHWPGKPVMPGVLIVEAMAQLAGIMLTQWQEAGNLAMIASLDNVKLRRPVIPGDQLRLHAESLRIKSRAASLKTWATVDGETVAQARMNFVLLQGETSET